jgi:YfiH family protein
MSSNSWYDYSSLFKKEHIKAGLISNRKTTPDQSDLDYNAICDKLDLDKTGLVIPEQVHSNRIMVCDQAGSPERTDGLVSSNNYSVVLSIRVADCIPIYLADPDNNVIGLIHAGWRGLVDDIIFEALKNFKQIGCDPGNITAVLGHSIRQCCFEVGPDVAEKFSDQYIQYKENNIPHVSLQEKVIGDLLISGMIISNIHDVGECSVHNEEFESYRRDSSNAGRMIAVIGFSN